MLMTRSFPKNRDFKTVLNCRICGSKPVLFLDLGKQPRVNSFFKSKTQKAPSFPVRLQFCPECALIQLDTAVNSDLLFLNYSHRTSFSKTFQAHCAALVDETAERFPNVINCRVLDIGSNDGCLLGAFKKKGFDVLGVEPSLSLSKEAKKKGFPTIAAYWNDATAKQVLKKGKVSVIAATSVLAQVADLHSFVKNCQNVLSPDGVMIAEVHYASNLIQKNEFDTIYHEHLSYFLLKPLIRLFEAHGLKIIDASSSLIHADALRIWAVHTLNPEKVKPAVLEMVKKEEQDSLHNAAIYHRFRSLIEKTRRQTLSFLKLQKKQGKTVVGFAAAAKASVLLNYFGITSDLVLFVVDQTSEKQEKFIANTGIQIKGFEELKNKRIDFLIIFSWNYAREIMQKTAFLSDKGTRFVLLIPKLKILKGVKDL